MPDLPPEVRRRPAAIRDLIELADAFDQIGHELSERFLNAVESTFTRLARLPGSAREWEDDALDIVGVRCSTVHRFRRYVIFYRETQTGIEILRVVPGAQNLRGLVGLEARGTTIADLPEGPG